MNPKNIPHPKLLAAAVVLSAALLGFPTASAQTPPTPDTTFNQAISTTFSDAGNWSPGLPVAGDDAKIDDTKTAAMTQTNANTLFGSLTLGVGSTINLAASNATGLATGQDIYFSNDSQLNFTSGSTNRAADYLLLSGATARLSPGSNTIPQGTVTGDGTTILNVNLTGQTFLRWTTSGFSGAMNFTASAAQYVQITRFGTAPIVGPGITNFGNNVRTQLEQGNRIDDSATVVLTGSSGGASNIKFDLGGNSETIGNLTIDSPTGATASAPTLRGSSALTVTGTTTFQGTADAVNIDTTGATNNLLTTDSMTFGGTGTWAVSGDGRIRLNAASGTRTITTTADASISNTLTGTQGFTKEGAGTLTLNGTNIYTGTATVNAGTLSLGNGTSSTALSDIGGLAVVSPAVVNLNYTGSDAVLSLNLDGSPAAAGTWGATGSGATHINDTFFTGTGVINNLNGNTGLNGVLFWDGGTQDILTDGDAISAGGTGIWDNAILNWDSGTIAHAAWLNTTAATAYFGGTTGTVTLGADMNIGNMVIEVPDAGTSGYFIGGTAEDNTLNFGGDKTITVTATGPNSSNYHTIRAGIAGSPTLNITGPNNNGMFFALEPPTGVTQTLGTINIFNTLASNKQLRLGGQSIGNVADAVTWTVTGNQLQVRKQDSTNGGPNGSSWTINQNISLADGRLIVDEGTLTMGGTDNFMSHSIEVESGGRLVLNGNWRIRDENEDFRVKSGGIVAPGGSIGTATFNWNSTRNDPSVGLVDLQTGSTYEWEVGASATDVIALTEPVVGGNAELVVASGTTLKVVDAGGSPSPTDKLTVFTYASGVVAPSAATLQTNMTIDLSGTTWTGSGTWGVDIDESGNGTIYITGIDGSAGPDNPYSTWASVNAPSGDPDDDFDGDGVPNAIEFALGGDKNTNDLDQLPVVADDGTNMTFTFVRDQDSADAGVSTVIEVGTDLVSWPSTYTVGADTGNSTDGVTVSDNEDGTDTVVLTVAKAPDAKKFARLKVVVTP